MSLHNKFTKENNWWKRYYTSHYCTEHIYEVHRPKASYTHSYVSTFCLNVFEWGKAFWVFLVVYSFFWTQILKRMFPLVDRVEFGAASSSRMIRIKIKITEEYTLVWIYRFLWCSVVLAISWIFDLDPGIPKDSTLSWINSVFRRM